MTSDINRLPSLICLEDFGGDWKEHIEAVYQLFRRDFIESQPKYENCWVRCYRDPIDDGKEEGFWHCTSDGPPGNRIPDLRRCERIAWVRYLIESNNPLIQAWPNLRKGKKRKVIWYNEEYVVILEEKIRKNDGFKLWWLVTAYCTDKEHNKQNMRKERDAALR